MLENLVLLMVLDVRGTLFLLSFGSFGFFFLFVVLDVIEPCFVLGSDVIEPIIVGSDVTEPMIILAAEP